MMTNYIENILAKAQKMADADLMRFENSSWNNDACGSIMFDYDNDTETFVQLFAFETEEDMKAEYCDHMYCVAVLVNSEYQDDLETVTNDLDKAISDFVARSEQMIIECA